MIILITIIFIIGFFLLYNTSKKATLSNTSFEKWLQSHNAVSKSIGLLLSLFSICWFVYEFGLGIGLFYAVTLFMTLGSLLVILLPLRKIRFKN